MLAIGGLWSVGGVVRVVLVLLDTFRIGIILEVEKILVFRKCRTRVALCRTSDTLDFLKNEVENKKSESLDI